MEILLRFTLLTLRFTHNKELDDEKNRKWHDLIENTNMAKISEKA